MNEYEKIVALAVGRLPIRMMIGTLRGYQKLLDKEDITEGQMQRFLENNWILLDVNARRIFPKYRLGEKFVADFLVETSDFNYVFVEIENPNAELYTRERPPRQSRKLREADAQIKEILSYTRNNILYLRDKLPFISTEKVQGLIIIGRSSKLTEERKQRLAQDNAHAKEYRILTYDELFEKARLLLENLGIRYSPYV